MSGDKLVEFAPKTVNEYNPTEWTAEVARQRMQFLFTDSDPVTS